MTSKHDQIDSYYNGKLSPEEMAGFDEHLATCSECQETLVLLHERQAANETKAVSPPDVPTAWEDFTKRIQPSSAPTATAKNDQKGAFIMKKKHFAYIAAAVLAVTILTPPVQTMAKDFVSKVFQTQVEETAPMVPNQETLAKEKDKVENGDFFPLNAETNSITDQGLTFQVTEAYIADGRVSIHYVVQDENGKELKVKATDLHHPEELFPVVLLKNGVDVDAALESNTPGFMTFDLFEADPTEASFALNVNIDQIKKTTGSWVGTIPLN